MKSNRIFKTVTALALAVLLVVTPMADNPLFKRFGMDTLRANAAEFTRDETLDLTKDSISYKGSDGTDKTANPKSENITDTDEGWAWYKYEENGYEANTLVLTNASIKGSDMPDSGSAYGIQVPCDSTIVVKGTNTVVSGMSKEGNCYGIFDEGTFTIRGDGTLNVTGAGTPNDAPNGSSAGVVSDDHLTIDMKGGTLNATGGYSIGTSYGIHADGDLWIKNGIVNAVGGSENNSYGIEAALPREYRCAVTIDNGTVTATGTCGIYTRSQIDVNGGDVIAYGNVLALGYNLKTKCIVKVGMNSDGSDEDFAVREYTIASNLETASNHERYRYAHVYSRIAIFGGLDKEIKGTAGCALTPVSDVDITLVRDEFQNVKVGDVFDTNVSGITATVTAVNSDTEMTVTFSGTPEKACTEPVTVSFPACVLTSNRNLDIVADTLWAVDAAAEYTIVYNANGGTVTPAADVTKLETGKVVLPTPERAGYVFLGWFDNEACKGTAVTNDTIYTADTLLYADWIHEFGYEIKDGEVTITKYYGAGGAIVIPSVIEGKPVVAIDDGAFAGKKLITSAVVPKSVKKIGYYAFGDTRVTEITFMGDPEIISGSYNIYTLGGAFNKVKIIAKGGTTNIKRHLEVVGEDENDDWNKYYTLEDVPAVTYTVTYNAKGGTGEMTAETAMENEPFTLSKNGFHAPAADELFLCWAIGAPDSITTVNAGDTYTFTGDTTVYAVWTKCPHATTIMKMSAKAPTCTKAGNNEFWICKDCGQVFVDETCTQMTTVKDQTIPAKWHTWDTVYTVDVEPTCKTAGSKSIHCVICDASYNSTKISATGHSYGEWETVTEPTCKTAGMKKRYCSKCGVEQPEIIPRTTHVWDTEYTVDEKATCTEAGSKSIHCANCDEKKDVTEISATGHNYSEWETVTAPTCTTAGSKKRTCTACDDVETEEIPIDSNVHTWNKDYTIDKEADCTEAGSKSIYCAICDAKKNVTVIPAKGHKYGAWETITAPTCTTAGSKKRICAVCDDVEMQEIDVDPNAHAWNEEYTIDKEADCTEAGSKSIYCAICDAKKNVTVIPAKGHKYGAWETVTEPTCTTAGSKKCVCTACDDVETEEIEVDPNAHTWSKDYTIDKGADCTTVGSKSIHCANCDAKNDVIEIPAIGHNYSEWETVTEPTCTTAGSKKRTCKVCQDVEIQEIEVDPNAHTWDEDYTVDKEATCTTSGSKSIHCASCDATKNVIEIPAKGYSDNEVTTTYHTHIQTYGDTMGESKNGELSGTIGEAKRLENIRITVDGNPNLGIQYSTHCQTYGWLPWSSNGEISGTQNEAKRLEAIKICLTGADKDCYDVYYRVHAESYGWLGWAKNGEASGTSGFGKRLEGIQIVVLKKGEKAPGLNYAGVNAITGKCDSRAYVARTEETITVPGNAGTPNVMYKTHVQTHGWQNWRVNGQMSGSTGEAKRLEAINIKLTNAPYSGDIVYTTHVQKYGWQEKENAPATWKKNGQMSGSTGEAKRLEAIRIKLTGEMAEHYDVYYRVHAQTYGWLGWAKNGEASGTIGMAKRMEGIQIVLVEKGGAAPADNYGGATSKRTQAYIQK